MKKYKNTILIVEDLPNDRLLIVKSFQALGVTDTIQTAGDGAEAIAYMMGEGKFADREKYPYPTFIMTDLKMPKLDGFAVLMHLKRNPEWAVIPTIVFTASSDLDDIKKSYQLGASSYHVKLTDLGELRKQLKVLYEYWITCEVPEIDVGGKQLPTNSRGKLGEKVPELKASVKSKQSR